MRRRNVTYTALLASCVSMAACSGGSPDLPLSDVSSSGPPTTAVRSDTATTTVAPGDVVVDVLADEPLGTISPLIRGVSGGVGVDYLRDVGITVNSWGGNPATRFNYEIGHAWNAGADWEYRNGNYGEEGDAAFNFGLVSAAAGSAVRLAVPTIGWVARDDSNDTCSFPTDDGGCDGAAGHDCQNPGPVADPTTANVPSDPASVAAWVERLVDAGLPIEFVAMDNEPELWGFQHYDVHPQCTTYEEILDTYVTYAEAVRRVAPDAQLLGPVTCCWFDYWNIAPGTSDGRRVDFLRWFLEQVRFHDEASGQRSIDLLDVHFYPQSGVYNDRVDPDTSARRLRSTRSLWDRRYRDESWISTAIAFIPRMLETVDESYPGTGLAISEWNFGADTDINGALAIADVLGIYGREGVDMASYWQFPPEASPGYFAFKMHGNYDGDGSSFTGTAVPAETSDLERVGAYAALDREGRLLRLMLINKDPDEQHDVAVGLAGAAAEPGGRMFRYSSATPGRIVAEPSDADGSSFTVELPASSITLLELALG